ILPEQQNGIWSVAFSPDGRLLASGQADGVVTLWDLASEHYLWSNAAHGGRQVPALAFSPDGELLVSGGEDARIQLWEVSSGELLGTLSGHTDVIQSVAFNAEGLLASSSLDRSVKVWQFGSRGTAARCLSTLQGHSGWVWSIACG